MRIHDDDERDDEMEVTDEEWYDDDLWDLVYDPAEAPDPKAWLALDEGERIIVVQNAHHRMGDMLPTEEQNNLHASMHAVVETQIAAGEPPEARQTVIRLLEARVPRHNAIHALANEVAEMTFGILREGQPAAPDALAKAYLAIDPKVWR